MHSFLPRRYFHILPEEFFTYLKMLFFFSQEFSYYVKMKILVCLVAYLVYICPYGIIMFGLLRLAVLFV